MDYHFRSLIRGKTRIGLAWAFVILLGLCSRQYPNALGVLLCFAGASIRYWASGFLRKDSRVAVGGPYAWVRNPLYLGTYLMAVGTVWAIGNLWLLALVTVAFAVIYHFIILDEEIKLRALFGEPYVSYCGLVPRFFPGFSAATTEKLETVNPEPSHHVFDWPLAAMNKAFEAYATFAGMIGFVAICAWAWRNL